VLEQRAVKEKQRGALLAVTVTSSQRSCIFMSSTAVLGVFVVRWKGFEYIERRRLMLIPIRCHDNGLTVNNQLKVKGLTGL
jgi:hypothetical protein